MTKVNKNAAESFIDFIPYHGDNTVVVIVSESEAILALYGHAIAKNENGKISITNAGFETKTTKSRLNSIPGVDIVVIDSVWYLNGNEWNGSWTII